MKYALVNPNWNFDGSIYFGCREAHLPLEFGYSKALLEAAGHTVEIIDGQLYKLTIDEITRRVESFAPDFTVVSTAPSYLFWRCAPPELTCPQEIIEAIRPWAGTVVLTGPHSSTTPKTALIKTGADIVIAGECEEVLVQLSTTPITEIPAAGYMQDDVFFGAGVRHASDMANLPALKWSKDDLRLHHHHHHRFDIEPDGWGAEMETSRGCPYSCSFCAKENFRNKYRKRPLDIVLEELDGLIDAGASYVYFIDEIFLPDKDLLQAVKQRNIQFGVQTRIDLWDFDMLQLLGEAGCVSIEAGVESITEEGRKELNKRCKMTTDSMTERLIHARNYVPFVQGNLIQAGTDDMAAVEAWRTQLKEHGVWANKPVPLFPYPGSPDYTKLWGLADDEAWERAHEHYLKLYDEFSDVQEARPLQLSVLEKPPLSRKKPMRILMTCDTVGGVWTYAMDLCSQLTHHGVDVLLAVLGPQMSDKQRTEATGIPGVNVHEHRGKLEWMDDPWNDVRDAGDWLQNLADEFNPDVVHLNGYAHATMHWKCPTVVVAHSCVHSWWNAVKKSDPPEEYHWYRQVVSASLKTASMVVGPTRAVLHDLRRHYNVDPANCRVIHNGCDLPETINGSREQFIFSAGRVWDEAKNFSALNEVAQGIDWPILVAGETQYNGSNIQLPNLRLLGKVGKDELRAYYASASIFVSPTKYEPFGLCALEAALSGCPLVLSDLDSLREVWQDNAIFIDPDNPDQIKRTLQDLINDEVKRRTYANRAQVHARQFTAARMGADYVRMYQVLMQDHTKSLAGRKPFTNLVADTSAQFLRPLTATAANTNVAANGGA